MGGVRDRFCDRPDRWAAEHNPARVDTVPMRTAEAGPRVERGDVRDFARGTSVVRTLRHTCGYKPSSSFCGERRADFGNCTRLVCRTFDNDYRMTQPLG